MIPWLGCRHKTDMSTLREMMPADMLQYCQEHGLLDAILSRDSDSDPASAAAAGKPQSTSQVGGEYDPPPGGPKTIGAESARSAS
jgi:hypothetical protein